jgi:hypothetical protein
VLELTDGACNLSQGCSSLTFCRRGVVERAQTAAAGGRYCSLLEDDSLPVVIDDGWWPIQNAGGNT